MHIIAFCNFLCINDLFFAILGDLIMFYLLQERSILYTEEKKGDMDSLYPKEMVKLRKWSLWWLNQQEKALSQSKGHLRRSF